MLSPIALMKPLLVLLVAGLSAGWALALTSEQETALTEAFEELSQEPTEEARSEAFDVLNEAEYSQLAWSDFFRNFFSQRRFTTELAESWTHLVEAGGRPVALASGVSAAEALGAAVTDDDSAPMEALHSFMNALNWLHGLGSVLDAADGPEIVYAVRDALGGQTAGVAPLAGHPPVADPAIARAGMQLALTLAEYGRSDPDTRAAIADALGLAPTARAIWTQTGVFVFDNTALNEHQQTSLRSLLVSIPADLHAVVAVIVPEAAGVNPAQPGLATSGQLVYIEPIPMDVMTEPDEFLFRRTGPVAPEFTISAARRLTAAIQEVQMPQRPGLAIQRDAILIRAGQTRDRYLRHLVSPSLYMQRPDELLPSVATLWFINAEEAFRTAMDFFHLRQREALDQFLLLADLFSGGRPATVLHATDTAGMVSYSQAPLSRTHVTKLQLPGRRPGVGSGALPVDLALIDGIQIGGNTWGFELSHHGGVARYRRR